MTVDKEKLISQVPLWVRENREPTREEREASHAASVQRYLRDEQPVLADLARAGYRLEHIQDLWMWKEKYKDAIPVLVKWLHKSNNIRIKDTIVRALTRSWASEAMDDLLMEFRALPLELNGVPKWTIGHAIESMADDRVFDEIRSLVLDRRHGTDRDCLVSALGRMKKRKEEAVETAMKLLDDEQVQGNAIHALGKLKVNRPSIVMAIRRFLDHPNAWVRKQAKVALKKIEGASDKGSVRV